MKQENGGRQNADYSGSGISLPWRASPLPATSSTATIGPSFWDRRGRSSAMLQSTGAGLARPAALGWSARYPRRVRSSKSELCAARLNRSPESRDQETALNGFSEVRLELFACPLSSCLSTLAYCRLQAFMSERRLQDRDARPWLPSWRMLDAFPVVVCIARAVAIAGGLALAGRP